ncbi:MAG: NAD(P)/FAD-dependent oxidoreductase [Syntrophomonas sp.]|nr:NAD(P)/FAD-dependent oxidoreductase [Syntrophomonas sp.]
MKEVVVIGAGPAGMMAAITAAAAGGRVTVLEKKDKVGRKLNITGKGRCNLTAAVDQAGLIKGMPGNGRFLYSAFHEFSNQDLIEFFARHGLPVKVERGQRVFPQSDDAGQVVAVLQQAMQEAGVKIITACEVLGLQLEGGRVTGVESRRGTVAATAVIIATGGLSYPGTGSTGDGYGWARAVGHHIIEPRPGLVPLVTAEAWVRELQGLALKNTRAVSFDAQGRKINEDFGELLFTHFGLSGPIILSMSRDIAQYIYRAGREVRLELDLKPALSEEKLDERLQRDLNQQSRKMFKNALADLLPAKMIPVMVNLSGIDPAKPCHQVSRGERLALGQLFKHLPLTITGTRPIAEAIVTAGGVTVKEVDPRTMQSKLVPGLFFAGEILDVDGYTGGYNLQACFSTGYIAGKSAAQV